MPYPKMLNRWNRQVEWRFLERNKFAGLWVKGSLVIGYWSLVIGYWSLVIGFSLMTNDQ